MNKLLLLVKNHNNYIVKFLIFIRLFQNQWAQILFSEKTCFNSISGMYVITN